MIRFIFLLVLIPLVLLIAAFSYRNAVPVSVDYLTSVIQLPLAVVLLLALIVGGLIGFLLNIMLVISLRAKIRQLKKKKAAMKSLSEVFNQTDDLGSR